MKRNVIANSVGTVWSTLISIAVVPVYLQILGIGSYALVGFAATLQALFLLFDLGLGMTTNREMARLAALENRSEEMHSLLRLLERLYWIGAVVIAVVIMLLAPWIALHWLHSSAVPSSTVANAIRLMGPVIALQFPFSLYSGALLGLQRHPALNVALVIGSTLRLLAVIPVLVFVSPAIEAFFVMQIAGTVVQTMLARRLVLRALPSLSSTRSAVRLRDLPALRRFAGGMAAITLASALVTQIDKIVVSRLLSLETFGYYTLAASIASGLTIFVVPIFASVFPRFSQLVSVSDERGVRELYDSTLQLLAALLVPVTAILVLFPREITWVWTGNSAAAEASLYALPFLAAAFALNGMVHVPYALQLAHGWTAPASLQNVIGVVILPVAMVMSVQRYGATGAAAVYAAWNLAALMVAFWLVRRLVDPRLVRPSGAFLSLIVSVPVVFLLRQLALPADRMQLLAATVAITCAALAASVIATPVTRQWLLEAAGHLKSRIRP